MKKFLISLLCVLLAMCIAGGGMWYGYSSTTNDDMPSASLYVNGAAFAPNRYTWNQPVLGGILHREFTASGEAMHAGTAEQGALSLEFPRGFLTTARVECGGVLLFDGPAENLGSGYISEPGSYALTVLCERTGRDAAGYGSLGFDILFEITAPPPPPKPEPPAEPTLATGSEQLEQGDIFTLLLTGIDGDVTPAVQTELGAASFLPMQGGAWFAAVPIANNRAAGRYAVSVTAGELSWELNVSVLPFDFPQQDLIIDTSDPQIGAASSAAANEEYNNTMYRLFPIADGEKHWDGYFEWPAEGRITTHFGTHRITNGDPNTLRYHWGMDIANEEGTPIYAPNGGRVIFSGELMATGNTIVIEHGGGLKSIYLHMNARHAAEGDMVEKGQHIGDMGSTGYSTGSHLHFEMRIGNQAISPEMLLTPDGGLYSLTDAGTD